MLVPVARLGTLWFGGCLPEGRVGVGWFWGVFRLRVQWVFLGVFQGLLPGGRGSVGTGGYA